MIPDKLKCETCETCEKVYQAEPIQIEPLVRRINVCSITCLELLMHGIRIKDVYPITRIHIVSRL